MSSIVFGVSTIDPLMTVDDKELKINFPTIEGNPLFHQLDKRNDSCINNVLKSSGRLR
ncbi:MAG: hypothetical protein ABI288_08695 [Ginsengibacter sp.]